MASKRTLQTISSIGIFLMVAALTLMGCQSQPAAPSPTTKPAVTTAPAAAPTPATTGAPTAAPQAAPTQPAASTAAAKTLKLGIMVSLTGPSSRLGMNLERFVRLGIDDINAKGGIKVGSDIYKLDAVTVDDKSTAEGARDAANRLILAEKVPFILGSVGAPTAGAQAATEPAKVLMFSYGATDKSLGTSFPLTFNGAPHILMRSGSAYDYLKKTYPNVKTVTILGPDDAAGRGYGENFERMAVQHGYTVLAKEYYPNDLKDFDPLVLRVVNQKPDAIDAEFGGRGPLMLGFMKSLSAQGYKVPMIAVSADLAPAREGAANMEDYTFSVLADWKADVVTANEKSIFQRYLQKYPEADLEPATIVSYNALSLITQAVEKAGTVADMVKVAQTLRDNEWTTIWSEKWGKSKFIGAKTFGLSAVPEQPVYLSGVRGGKVLTIDAVKAALP